MNMLVFLVRFGTKNNRDSILAGETLSRTQGTINSLISMKRAYLMTNAAIP